MPPVRQQTRVVLLQSNSVPGLQMDKQAKPVQLPLIINFEAYYTNKNSELTDEEGNNGEAGMDIVLDTNSILSAFLWPGWSCVLASCGPAGHRMAALTRKIAPS